MLTEYLLNNWLKNIIALLIKLTIYDYMSFSTSNGYKLALHANAIIIFVYKINIQLIVKLINKQICTVYEN